MGEYLINLDTEIFLWFNSRNNLFWDIAMKMATGKLIWIGLYLSLIYAMYKAYGWKTTLVMAVMSGLAVTAADQMTASVLRPIFERLRPANLNNPISHLVHIVDGYRSGGFSFPSCHAANTFALATLTSLLFRRWRFTVAIVFWAIVNCYSRIYLGVHYPGDLLAGTVIGCLCGGIFYVVGRLIISYWSGCTVPGATDRKRVASFNGKKFYYRPVDVCKLFPGDVLGPKMVKGLLAPMPWSKIMVTGGVEPTEQNLSSWFQAGVFAVGMGSKLFPKDKIAEKDWAWITAKCREALSFCHK